ncbi:DUF6228 family protein [Chromohalobacter israelensis]
MLFSGIRGDYFTIVLLGPVSANRNVWAYTDAHGLADLFEWMASKSKPWRGSEGWESIEGEFKFYASCSALGAVTFDIEINHPGIAEAWRVTTKIKTDFGQLPSLATKARSFFGPSPS